MHIQKIKDIIKYLNINDIEKYKGIGLYVERKDAVELEEDEYFIADLIGMTVYTDDNKEFGILDDVLKTGANEVYVVKSKEHGEVLIPAIKQCILDVDVNSKTMKVHLLDGLL